MNTAPQATTATKEKKAARPYHASQADLARIAVITPLFQQIDQLDIQTAGIYIKLGYQFIEWQAESKNDDNRYSIVIKGENGKPDRPEEVSYFKAAWVTAGFKQAKVYRCINRAYEHMQAENPAPQSVLDMATSIGMDLTKESVQKAIADAYLAADQPEKPTPGDVVKIAGDAFRRAEAAPVDNEKKFKTLLNTALEFARDHNIAVPNVNDLLTQELAALGCTQYVENGLIILEWPWQVALREAAAAKAAAPSVVDSLTQMEKDAAASAT